jgi:chromosomal replication initiator protein
MSDQFPLNHFFDTSKLNKINNLAQPILNQRPATVNEPSFSVEELKDLTAEILNSISGLVNPQKFNAYFKNTFTVISMDEAHIEFAVTTSFIKKMIEQHNRIHIENAITQSMGDNFTFEIRVMNSNQSLSSNNANVLNSVNESKKQTLTDEIALNNYQVFQASTVQDTRFTINDLYPSKDDLETQVESKVLNHLSNKQYGQIIDPRKNFKNFVVGPNNNFAHASAIAVSKSPGIVYPSLYIHGSSGLGKTHLLHAVANHIQEVNPELRICITTAKSFMTEMVDALQSQTLPEFRRKYSEQIDVLMIDDIQELKNKTSTQNEFFHVFNQLHNKGKQLIFTSDKHPKEIDGIEDRIRTRLAWGMVVDIQLPDLETRIAILKRKAIEEDIFLPDDVVDLIAKSIKNNIRELEGSLIKLGAFSSVFNVDIDLEIAKEQLKLDDNPERDLVTFESISKEVSAYYKIPLPDLLSKARNKEVTHARHVAMYLISKIMKSTLVSIGQYYNRDHSTILHAIDKIAKRVKENTSIKQELFEIESKI